MRILLVTQEKNFAGKLDALNPELEYCGIVVDDVEAAKKTLAERDLSQVPIYPMSKLKTCAETLDYDYVLCIENIWHRMVLINTVRKYVLSRDKLLCFSALTEKNSFLMERSLVYFKKHAAEFKMFATGISTVTAGIDIMQFKRRLFNFGRGSQDLYYNFQTAKAVILYSGNSKIRYALIGLAPYSFHYDLSRTYHFQFIMLPHFITFNDLHNFFVPIEVYKNFLSKEYLIKRLPAENFDINNPYSGKSSKIMDKKDIDAATLTWAKKYYPETRDENIKILDDYLTLCEENNIRPVMFMVPVTEKYIANFNNHLLEEFYVLIEQALSKHPSARFFDGWKLKDFTYDDFYDHEHLNVHGAAKFSTYLNDFIEELEFNYYRDGNSFHNRLNDTIEEFDFCNHFEI